MKIKPLPAGFVIPAQPVKASKPPVGTDWFTKSNITDAAILYAFDLIEHDGEDLRKRSFLDRKAALGRLLSGAKAGILVNEHIAEDGPTVFAHACRLGTEGIVSKRIDSTYQSGPCRVWIKVRNPAGIAVQRDRSEIWNRLTPRPIKRLLGSHQIRTYPL
jgi:ATP dependent DNA ligase domain